MEITKLTTMLGLGGVNGTVALAALQGLFTVSNAPMLAVTLMAGPGAILTASMLDGAAKQRMFAALLAGVIATLIIILAAGLGPKFLSLVNLKIIKISGAIAIGFIALLILGIKIPENSPLAIMLVGLVAGIIWR